MVVIRLARGGQRNRPFYRIVVADSRAPRDGRFIEQIGFFNPLAKGKDSPLRLSVDKVNDWVAKGAQLSLRVKHLVKQCKKAATENSSTSAA